MTLRWGFDFLTFPAGRGGRFHFILYIFSCLFGRLPVSCLKNKIKSSFAKIGRGGKPQWRKHRFYFFQLHLFSTYLSALNCCFSSVLSIGSMLERLVLKNLHQRTSQHVKWTSGARVLTYSLSLLQTYANICPVYANICKHI